MVRMHLWARLVPGKDVPIVISRSQSLFKDTWGAFDTHGW